MGLSILIPVYNFDVTALVQTLAEQLQQIDKASEIILLDDHSENSFDYNNSKLSVLSSVKYLRNENNEGRTASRQKLASLSANEYLLFLDCDSKVIHNNFIAAYFEEIKKGTELVVGGRIYSSTPPPDCQLRLHWKYGSRRESGNKAAFMSNNFLVKKSLFQKLDLSFQLPGYGHEDTWWGIQFRNLGVSSKKINNPILHDALEKAETYIVKSENALANLLLLEKNVDPSQLKKEIKLYRWYKNLRSLGLTGVYLFKEKIFHKKLYKNLVSCDPKLVYFDLYRLALLIRLSKKK